METSIVLTEETESNRLRAERVRKLQSLQEEGINAISI